MKGEEAMEIFELVVKENLLPETIDELVPLSFIGQAAVSFYRTQLKVMKDLNMTEAQRKVTLRDGQDAGELLLDIEKRVGELAYKEPRVPPKGGKKEPRKPERLGLKRKRMESAQAIAGHPDVVEKVKKQARANEDIPTKTAVLSEIKYEKEKERRKTAEGKKQEIKAIISIEQVQYINALDRCIHILPQKPPKQWDDAGLKEAKAKAKIIIKLLEVFNEYHTTRSLRIAE